MHQKDFLHHRLDGKRLILSLHRQRTGRQHPAKAKEACSAAFRVRRQTPAMTGVSGVQDDEFPIELPGHRPGQQRTGGPQIPRYRSDARPMQRRRPRSDSRQGRKWRIPSDASHPPVTYPKTTRIIIAFYCYRDVQIEKGQAQILPNQCHSPCPSSPAGSRYAAAVIQDASTDGGSTISIATAND